MKKLTKNEKKMIDILVKNYAQYVQHDYIYGYDFNKTFNKFLTVYESQYELLKAIGIEIAFIEYDLSDEEIKYTIYIYKDNELLYFHTIDFIRILTNKINTIF